MSDSQRKALQVTALVLAVGALLTFAPFFAPLLLAAWAAGLLQPAVRRLERRMGGRRRGAALIVVLTLLLLMLPLAAIVTTAVLALPELIAQVRSAIEGRGSVLMQEPAPESLRDWVGIIGRHGSNVWRAVVMVARTSASAFFALMVFVVALQALTASGARSYRWLARRVPLSQRAFSRLTRAFHETGRGLIVSAGGSALAQGLVATVGWFALGVPRAAILGPLSALCALVPIVGTGIVWVPLAIDLAATGSYVRAAGVVGVGLFVGVVDNFVRPFLARYGKLTLSGSVVLVSLLGGIAAFGPVGALFGPLLVRLAIEALAILREGNATRRSVR